jgi:hypothetical protein
MSETVSEREAAGRKAELHANAITKRWAFQNFASAQAAADFVNESPAQVAGEISATVRNDGTVGLFYFI